MFGASSPLFAVWGSGVRSAVTVTGDTKERRKKIEKYRFPAQFVHCAGV